VIVTKPRQVLCGLLVAGAALCCTPAQAGILWYNGNRDNRDAVINQTSNLSPGGADGLVYENFVVSTGSLFSINGVFANEVKTPLFSGIPTPTTAAWEIRTGVSAGDGGTVVANGDGAVSVTPTGRTSTVFAPFTATEFKLEVDGLNVTLGAGTYWLSIAPDTDGVFSPAWSVSTTSGASSVGTPPGNDGNSFFTSNLTGDFFTPTSDIEGPGKWDYSFGVVGNPLPEPGVIVTGLGASLSLAGYGLLGYARRRLAVLVGRS
jgi:hypothetical protein